MGKFERVLKGVLVKRIRGRKLRVFGVSLALEG